MNSHELGTAKQIDGNCIEIEFANHIQENLKLDSPSVLLEIRPAYDLWGVFYTAKGLQWDLWSDCFDDVHQIGIKDAIQRPLEAGYQLLRSCPRRDYDYVPEEE